MAARRRTASFCGCAGAAAKAVGRYLRTEPKTDLIRQRSEVAIGVSRRLKVGESRRTVEARGGRLRYTDFKRRVVNRSCKGNDSRNVLAYQHRCMTCCCAAGTCRSAFLCVGLAPRSRGCVTRCMMRTCGVLVRIIEAGVITMLRFRKRGCGMMPVSRHSTQRGARNAPANARHHEGERSQQYDDMAHTSKHNEPRDM